MQWHSPPSAQHPALSTLDPHSASTLTMSAARQCRRAHPTLSQLAKQATHPPTNPEGCVPYNPSTVAAVVAKPSPYSQAGTPVLPIPNQPNSTLCAIHELRPLPPFTPDSQQHSGLGSCSADHKAACPCTTISLSLSLHALPPSPASSLLCCCLPVAPVSLSLSRMCIHACMHACMPLLLVGAKGSRLPPTSTVPSLLVACSPACVLPAVS
jgi:hypothetical protein